MIACDDECTTAIRTDVHTWMKKPVAMCRWERASSAAAESTARRRPTEIEMKMKRRRGEAVIPRAIHVGIGPDLRRPKP